MIKRRFRVKQPSIDQTATILPGARISGDVTISARANIWYNAVIRGDMAPISIGERTNIQDGSIVHVDERFPTRIGSDVTVGHGCILHGCAVGDHVLIGMGSIVLNGAILEDGCMLGAGSLVTEGTVIPAGMLAFGRPAKAIRPVKPEEIEGQRRNIEHYLAMAKEHAGI